ncbi:TfoX/Sxy family protein [Enterovibrio sp. 27052020O]|uniref:TfoX/Sxy family protein n=1 Tax=Enterovibrio sp. 27052020O TaxID=3241166 RepID=UPI0038904B27
MAYDEALTQRFRLAVADQEGITDKRMMGGVCFLYQGNMLGGADKGRFMFRVGKANEVEALSRPGASAMELGGRKMSGLIFVDEHAVDDTVLRQWIDLAMTFVATLPAK